MKLTEAKQIIEDATTNGTPAFLKGLMKNNPSWEQFLNHLDYQLNKGPAIKLMNADPKYTVFNGVLRKHNFYYQTRDVINEPNKAKNFFPEVIDFKNFFVVIYQENAWGGTSFINFSGGEPNVPSHCDDWVNVHWQCQGTTTWETRNHEDDIEPSQVYVMEPGDVIVVPARVPHAVNYSGPRAGIVLSYQFKDSEDSMYRPKAANEKGVHIKRPYEAPENYFWE
jgi:mannose-6-phosphate isomerase-like protein (cupin superfamily)